MQRINVLSAQAYRLVFVATRHLTWSNHDFVWFVETIEDVLEDSVVYVISIGLVLDAFRRDVGSHSRKMMGYVKIAL